MYCNGEATSVPFSLEVVPEYYCCCRFIWSVRRHASNRNDDEAIGVLV